MSVFVGQARCRGASGLAASRGLDSRHGVRYRHDMNPDVRTMWTAALRSGKYAQATGALHRVDPDGTSSYCCMGVLCDLAMKSGVMLEKRSGVDEDGTSELIVYNSDYEFPPHNVVAWAGAVSANMQLGNDGGFLSVLNDEKYTFSQIADLIDKEDVS